MQDALEFLSKETIFKTILEMFGTPTVPSRPPGFPTLVLLILEQQVSIDSAKATFDRLKTLTPHLTPEEIALLSDEQLRTIGVSRQKINYIKGLANAIINKEIDLESFPHKPAELVREELIKLKGIGNWTIDVYLMFCLQSPDIIPLSDIGVIRTMNELLDIHTKEEMEIEAQKWSPYRSMATYLLWHYYLRKRNRKVNYSL